jgi:thiol-disulfide isomerase/thioredoxin
MNPQSQRLGLGLALALLLTGLVWTAYSILEAREPLALRSFSFPDLEMRQHSSEQWQGKILLINFWATWCPPCQKEMPHFIEFQKRYEGEGLQVVAIAIDNPDQVREFAPRFDFNFPILLGGTEAMDLSREWGNRHLGLPFTAIFDRNGVLRYAQGGMMTPPILEKQLKPLL